jgi:hypothetical protein
MVDLARKPMNVIMGLEWAFCHSFVSEMTQKPGFRVLKY